MTLDDEPIIGGRGVSSKQSNSSRSSLSSRGSELISTEMEAFPQLSSSTLELDKASEGSGWESDDSDQDESERQQKEDDNNPESSQRFEPEVNPGIIDYQRQMRQQQKRITELENQLSEQAVERLQLEDTIENTQTVSEIVDSLETEYEARISRLTDDLATMTSANARLEEHLGIARSSLKLQQRSNDHKVGLQNDDIQGLKQVNDDLTSRLRVVSDAVSNFLGVDICEYSRRMLDKRFALYKRTDSSPAEPLVDNPDAISQQDEIHLTEAQEISDKLKAIIAEQSSSLASPSGDSDDNNPADLKSQEAANMELLHQIHRNDLLLDPTETRTTKTWLNAKSLVENYRTSKYYQSFNRLRANELEVRSELERCQAELSEAQEEIGRLRRTIAEASEAAVAEDMKKGLDVDAPQPHGSIATGSDSWRAYTSTKPNDQALTTIEPIAARVTIRAGNDDTLTTEDESLQISIARWRKQPLEGHEELGTDGDPDCETAGIQEESKLVSGFPIRKCGNFRSNPDSPVELPPLSSLKGGVSAQEDRNNVIQHDPVALLAEPSSSSSGRRARDSDGAASAPAAATTADDDDDDDISDESDWELTSLVDANAETSLP